MNITLPPINVNWSCWENNSNVGIILPKPNQSDCPSSLASSSTSPRASPRPIESTVHSPPQKTRSKRGRKPCANPTPQALRQRAYRLRKQMKKEQNQKPQCNTNAEQLKTIVENHIYNQSNDSRLSDHEHAVAEILISLRASPLLVQ